MQRLTLKRYSVDWVPQRRWLGLTTWVETLVPSRRGELLVAVPSRLMPRSLLAASVAMLVAIAVALGWGWPLLLSLVLAAALIWEIQTVRGTWLPVGHPAMADLVAAAEAAERLPRGPRREYLAATADLIVASDARGALASDIAGQASRIRHTVERLVDDML